eukprot:gene6-878_t
MAQANAGYISQMESSDARIKARRQRAEALLKGREDSGNQNTKDSSTMHGGAEACYADEQKLKSMARLKAIEEETNQKLIDIRQNFDLQTNAANIVEENARLDRYEALQIEAVTSGRKNAAVEMKWASLLQLDIPQDLHGELENQKDACNAIIESKRRMLREFQSELRQKQEEFVSSLKQQYTDVKNTITAMRTQYQQVLQAYKEEFQQIEHSLELDRSELRDSNKKEMTKLFKAHSKQELETFREKARQREQEFQKSIEQLRSNDATEYTILKIEFENNVQELEMRLTKFASTYLLNREKLDYNLQVITQRQKEAVSIVTSHKNALNRSRYILNNLSARYEKMEAKYKVENHDLTEEYKRLTKQFKDLQLKNIHFQRADEQQQSDVRVMNEEQVKQLKQKLVDCDRIIHEQQLGLPYWQAVEHDEVENEQASERDTATQKSAEKSEEAQMTGKFSASKVRKVLDLIKEEAMFLLDGKVRTQIEKPEMDEKHKDVLVIDAVLRYIGVQDQQDVDDLVAIFYGSQDDDDEHLNEFTQEEVLQKIQDFMDNKENNAV